MSAWQHGRDKWTYNLVSVFSPETSEGIDIGSHTDEVGASTTRNELGRNDLCYKSVICP
jgi:hypothetical protein